VSGDTSCQHTPSNWIVDKPASCGTAGAQHKECTKCGEVISAEEIPATNNHSWNEWSITSQPSCSTFGSKSHSCSICGKTETAQIAKSNHTWGNWTDLGNGTETRECSVCHEDETRECANMQKVEAFAELVAAVGNANSVETKWTAIKNALTNYNTLSSSEKDEASEAYALLATEIAEYNAEIRGINQQSTQATSDAINLFAGTLSVLAFAAYLLLQA
jgi:hypothetical protein